MTSSYEIIFKVAGGQGNYGADRSWQTVKRGRMTRSAALGLLSQFAMQYRAQLRQGAYPGRLVAEKQPS